jgi:hypothetical protein
MSELPSMSTYPLPEVIRRWDRGDFTAEQTIGHLAQHLLTVSQQLADHEKRIRLLEQQLSAKA